MKIHWNERARVLGEFLNLAFLFAGTILIIHILVPGCPG